MGAGKQILATVRAVLATRTIVSGKFVTARMGLDEVVEASGCPRRPVLRVLDRLTREGWLALVEDIRERPAPGECGSKRRNPTYRVVKDIRLHRAHQDRIRVTCRDKIWSTLRAVRRATLGDLQRLTGCGEEVCREYLHHLRNHGFVRQAGLAGREKNWVLIQDAGPRRPETPEKSKTGEEA